MIKQILVSLAVIVLTILIKFLLENFLRRKSVNSKISPVRFIIIRKIIFYFTVLFIAVGLIAVWGIDFKNLWIFISGIAGIVAIGFFAHWSLLSNITANLFLFLFLPFRLGDEIVVEPENIQGRVADFNIMFITLETKEGDMVHIPNNIFFQRFTKVISRHSASRVQNGSEE